VGRARGIQATHRRTTRKGAFWDLPQHGSRIKKIHAFKYLANGREKVLQIVFTIAAFLLIHK
jgi:hypothetical protein